MKIDIEAFDKTSSVSSLDETVLRFSYSSPSGYVPAQHHLKKMAAVTWCFTGDLQQAEQIFKPIRQVAPVAMDFTGPIPLPTLQSCSTGSTRRVCNGIGMLISSPR